jgi:subtilisin family serine protease
MRNFRVFLSSPGDVAEERLRAHEILQMLPQEPAWRGRISIEIVRWDNPYSPTPMYANLTPQDAVNQHLPKPSECDLVVLILWSRFGTPLKRPLKPDRSCYLSGTEWEYEDAAAGRVPTLVYRRISDPQVSLRDPEYSEKKRQLELVDAFFKRFTEPGGAATGGYIPYNDVTEFKDKFRRLIEGSIRQALDATISSLSQAVTASEPPMLAIVDRLSRELEAKEREIAALRHILILKSNPVQSRPDEYRPGRDIDPRQSHMVNVEVADLDRAEVEALPRDPAVIAVAPAIPMKLIEPVASADALAETLVSAWGVTAVGADTSPYTGRGIVVALIDTGIDAAHPAFHGLTIIQRDFTEEGNGDRHGHGTHFAGTVFGRSVDGMRIGVAPGVERALIAKVVGSRGVSSDAVLLGLNWAIEQGANVIAMSLRFDMLMLQRHFRELSSLPSITEARPLEAFRSNVRLFEALFELARNRSSIRPAPFVILAAAGNESQRDVNPNAVSSVSSPAADVVSVAALGRDLRISPFSNVGATVAAPGEQIPSARAGGGLKISSGTSMAAAHVAGVAALWAERLAAGGLSTSDLSAQLLGSASRGALPSEFDPFDVGAGIARAPRP